MSTKFSVSPSPRKRPWICKRSPPCLIPDPIPKTLLCTYVVRILTGPFSPQIVRGTFALPHLGPGWVFEGADTPPGGPFWIHWSYIPSLRTAGAWSTYGTPAYVDMCTWDAKPAGIAPNIRWVHYTPVGAVYDAGGVCLITS